MHNTQALYPDPNTQVRLAFQNKQLNHWQHPQQYKNNNPIEKWGKNLNSHLPEPDTHGTTGTGKMNTIAH